MNTRPLLDYAAALGIVLDNSTRLPAETCAPADAVGRVLAEPVDSAVALPPFDNSAMDGFALGGGDAPVAAGATLEVSGEQAAGDENTLGSGQAWAIMTGARLPDGFDRVIPVEQVHTLATREDGEPARIRLEAAVRPGQNVRLAGSDVAVGERVLAAGTRVQPRHLMLLAALGVASVPVIRRPRVAVLCTGRELVEDASTPLQPGQIRNSNGPFLAAQLTRSGAEVVHAETVDDDEPAFEAALQRALAAGVDAVLTTGAVSMGRYDFVPSVLDRIGAHTLFHKVAIRPGKPLLFARLADGPLLFGLPGNPISGAVGLRFFVEPALRAMTGRNAEVPLEVPLAEPLRKKAALRYHLKARVCSNDRGEQVVRVLDGQESYRIRPLAEANAWVVVEAGIETLAAGDRVAVHGMGHDEAVIAEENTP
jgi:molybdopterin molybdotransferase